MNIKYKRLSDDWAEMSIGLKPEELDRLISGLKSLRLGDGSHFHIRNTFEETKGIADIVFCLVKSDIQDNMKQDAFLSSVWINRYMRAH